MARASRSKRSVKGPRLVLMATSRFRRVSRAFQTSPMPPAPSAERISYGPSRVPGARAIEVGSLPFPKLFEQRDLPHWPDGRQRSEEGVDICQIRIWEDRFGI